MYPIRFSIQPTKVKVVLGTFCLPFNRMLAIDHERSARACYFYQLCRKRKDGDLVLGLQDSMNAASYRTNTTTRTISITIRHRRPTQLRLLAQCWWLRHPNRSKSSGIFQRVRDARHERWYRWAFKIREPHKRSLRRYDTSWHCTR